MSNYELMTNEKNYKNIIKTIINIIYLVMLRCTMF